MKHIHWKFRSVLVLGLLGLTACTTFHSVEPIDPKVAGPRNLTLVDSLQPALKWKPSTQAESYDLIVYKPGKTQAFGETQERERLMKVYYRERLTDTAHRLEEPLQPDAEYYWSVRIRSGDKVSEWSRYDYRMFLVLAWHFTNNALFGFRTPSK